MAVKRGKDDTLVIGRIIDRSIIAEKGDASLHQPGAHYMFPGGPNSFPATATASQNVAATTSSQVLYRVYFPFGLHVSNIMFEVMTAQPGALMSVGIYDQKGNRLGWSGAVDASSTGIKTAIAEEFEIPAAGFYWIGWMNNTLTAGVRAENSAVAFNVDFILNTGRAHKIEKGGINTSAVQPTTIDLSTYSAVVRNMPFIKFQS